MALAILCDMQRASAEALAVIGATPRAAWDGYVNRLVELNLGALTAALAEFVTLELSSPVREAQVLTPRSLEQLLHEAQTAGLVRKDLGALELVLAIGMITRPQPEAIQSAAPTLVPQLISILLAGMRPQPDPRR